MADNSTPVVGNDTYATDDVATLNGVGSSGVKVPRTKVMFGDDNDARDASTAFPLPGYRPNATSSGTLTANDAVVAAPIGDATTGFPQAMY